MTYNSDYLSFVKKLLIDILMGTIFLILLSFALWLIWLTFFREYFDTGVINELNGTNISSEMATGLGTKQHFHNVVDPVTEDTELLSSCILCHEDLPHVKTKETRAFLNAHGYFMACEVCHIQQDINLDVSYLWKDKETGAYSNSNHNNDNSRIVPTVMHAGVVQTLEKMEDKNYVTDYLEINQVQIIKKDDVVWDKTHKNILSEPVSCVDCHTNEKTPFLPFEALSYSAIRVEELRRIEVAGMVKKYEHFYLPNLDRNQN